MQRRGKLQLQLELPYKQEPHDDPRVRSYLEQGYRIVQLQRISDHEAVITFAIHPAPVPPAAPLPPPGS